MRAALGGECNQVLGPSISVPDLPQGRLPPYSRASFAMTKPTKRTALATLTVKRLGGLCDAFELDRTGLTLKDDLIGVLACSKRANFAEVLDTLGRKELKSICQAHELDDSGKDRAKIAARILGNEPAAPSTPPPAASKKTVKVVAEKPGTKKANGKKAKSSESTGSLGFEDKLWAAADLLRNNMMSDTILAAIAHDLVAAIRRSVTIDWTQKEAVRADMRRKVRRLLRKHGYPPDKQELAVLTVIEQAERVAKDWARAA
ncbi:type I restriction enzyme endonuclease domain-containing protein [Enhygromyxa salina]|uniref:Type I restriction enzyme HindI endonuclease subunit-like C-terminal domain-containing protein n=1 Tax=Enhygromyxa salina TaxID=215803 RepID=A0A2S9YAI4_9BACT|nr:type I restriction enzyme endonuclease domain-containing protein [Enhygromyxa salina]PRQ02026.1 hypothetical protein ENSA7_55990 [Enhygromyxa salina]